MDTPSVQTWVPGLAVAHFVLVREIARGGMGEIWLARQTGAGFDRLVVLKRVIPGPSADATAMTMFLDEARIAYHLNHPNIVQVFELRQEPPTAFLVMEYLEGQTLSRFARRMVERAGRVPAALAVALVAGAAKGLGYAHRRGGPDGKALKIVHRDVSPQNLFVTYEGGVKVLDFGIARAAGRLGRTLTGVIKGKLGYMSPEQSGGGGTEVTGAADVYALGIVLFELVTGTRFYGKADDLGILRRLAVSAPAPLPSSRAAVEPELEAILVRALEPEPEARYADGQHFFEALEGWRKRHPAPENEPGIAEAMAELFAPELEALGVFHREAALTPSPGSEPSMPARRPTRTVAPGLAPDGATKTHEPRVASIVTVPANARARVAPAPPSASSAVTLRVSRSQVSQLAASPGKSGRSGALVAGVLIIGGALAAGWAWVNAGATRGAQGAVAVTDAGLLTPTRTPAFALTDPGLGTPTPIAARPAAGPATDAGPATRPPVTTGAAAAAASDTGLDTPTQLTKRGAAPKERVVVAGALTLDTEPWTQVFLGKQLLGETPLVERALPAGSHRLRLINAEEKVDTFIEITIKPRETTVKKLAF